MPISILPQDHDGQELYNAISSFFPILRLEIFSANAMPKKKKVFRCLISSSISSATSFLTAACTCSRRPAPSKSPFQRIRSTVF